MSELRTLEAQEPCSSTSKQEVVEQLSSQCSGWLPFGGVCIRTIVWVP